MKLELNRPRFGRTAPPHGHRDEPVKMVRAEKEGATIGPTHGSLMEAQDLQGYCRQDD